SLRQRRDVAGARHELGTVIHPDGEATGHVVLEVRRLTTLGLCDRLHVVGPAPPGLEHEPTDLGVPDLQDLRLAVVELSDLIWRSEPHVLRLLHRCLLPLVDPVEPLYPYLLVGQ